MIRGALFDMDGVLIDSEAMGRDIFYDLAHERGYDVERNFFIKLLGITDEATNTLLRKLWGPDCPCEEIQNELRRIRRERAIHGQMPVKRGMEECMAGLKARGIRIALATSSPRHQAEEYIAAIPAMQNVFDAVICGEEAGRSKPAPDIYLMACEKLGVEPAQAAAVEDSYNGIRSAHAAGMQALMVPDLLEPTQEIAPLCAAVLPSLTDVIDWIRDVNA